MGVATSFSSKATSLLSSLLLVALVTAFVLPGRPSGAAIKGFFTALSTAVSATLGAVD